jgi:hypothetical protein
LQLCAQVHHNRNSCCTGRCLQVHAVLYLPCSTVW